MSVLDNYVCEGQMSIFDLGIWSGKMSQEPLVQTTEKTSEWYLKKLQELRIKPPQYLDLRASGQTVDASWETGGALLGVYMMHSFGESPKDVRESRLSQILEENPHPKYSLSEKACQGILNRANRRGKKLPEQLEQALIRQATLSKFGGGGCERDSHGKSAGKGALIQTEKSGTLGVSQDQTLIEVNKTYCIGNGQAAQTDLHDIAGTLNCMHDQQAILCYGFDSYNLSESKEISRTIASTRADNEHIPCCYSQDAYDKYGENQQGASLKASGGNYGGGYREPCNTVGALCARDFKGVGSQYVNEGKVIVQKARTSSE